MPNLIIIYEGDITKKLKACRTDCPYRLLADGNTEQTVLTFRGGGSKGIPEAEFRKTAESIIIREARTNGPVLSWHWSEQQN